MDIIGTYEWFAMKLDAWWGRGATARASVFANWEASESDMHSFVLRLRAENGGSGKVKMTESSNKVVWFHSSDYF